MSGESRNAQINSHLRRAALRSLLQKAKGVGIVAAVFVGVYFVFAGTPSQIRFLEVTVAGLESQLSTRGPVYNIIFEADGQRYRARTTRSLPIPVTGRTVCIEESARWPSGSKRYIHVASGFCRTSR